MLGHGEHLRGANVRAACEALLSGLCAGRGHRRCCTLPAQADLVRTGTGMGPMSFSRLDCQDTVVTVGTTFHGSCISCTIQTTSRKTWGRHG